MPDNLANASSRLDALGDRLKPILESQRFQNFIIAVILLNAVTLGLETSKSAMASFGGLLSAIDTLCLAIFIAEIAAKLVTYRWAFFKNAWNVFDFAIVAVALVPAGEGLSVVRALRILRALRLISMVPQMRTVVQALLSSVPAMGSVMALLSLIYYVAAVMATKLFGADFPDWFGTIGASLYTLFQVMTLESWSMGIVRPVMEKHPYAWAFFVPFILVMTFMVLNLFIAIVVNSMSDAAKAAETTPPLSAADTGQPAPVSADPTASAEVSARANTGSADDRAIDTAAILAELKALRADVAALRSERGDAQRRVA